MHKESSYQKLKRELVETKANLQEVALRPSSKKSIIIIATALYNKKVDDMIWFGNSNTQNENKFTGILNQIKNDN